MSDGRLRAVIAEDEAVLREELHAHVEALWPELRSARRLRTARAALAALDAHRRTCCFSTSRCRG